MVAAEDELAARAASRVGTVLSGKYRIERVLGIGGMAAVYAATHRNGRRVAIKVLHPELSLNADMRRRFLREGQVANAVNHPGAVIVIDDDVADDGSAFLVMELLEGQVIEALWEANDRRLPPRTVLAIARELCEVLEVAHRAGIVHRDIKPENLFLTNEGRLKVLDFGIARVRDVAVSSATQTGLGLVLGTPAFMAPEQARGHSSLVDAQTDVWAVGATMFTLLSGETVHEAGTSQHLVLIASMEPARSLASVLPAAAPALIALVDRALADDKRARWRSAEAMRVAILEVCTKLFGNPAPDLDDLGDLTHVRGSAPELDETRLAPAKPSTRHVTETALAEISDEVTEPRRAERTPPRRPVVPEPKEARTTPVIHRPITPAKPVAPIAVPSKVERVEPAPPLVVAAPLSRPATAPAQQIARAASAASAALRANPKEALVLMWLCGATVLVLAIALVLFVTIGRREPSAPPSQTPASQRR